MATLSIGRSRTCSIVIAAPSVSRHHADVTETEAGQFRIVDRGSTSGSFLLANGTWRRFTRADFGRGDRFRLGDFECSLDELLRYRKAEVNHEATPLLVERDPVTGQIVVRRR